MHDIGAGLITWYMTRVVNPLFVENRTYDQNDALLSRAELQHAAGHPYVVEAWYRDAAGVLTGHSLWDYQQI